MVKKFFLAIFLCVNITNSVLASSLWYSVSLAMTYYGLGRYSLSQGNKGILVAGTAMLVSALLNDIHKIVTLKNRFTTVTNLRMSDCFGNFEEITENEIKTLKLKENIQPDQYQHIFNGIYQAIDRVAYNETSTIKGHWIPLLGTTDPESMTPPSVFAKLKSGENYDVQKKQLEDSAQELDREISKECAKNLSYQSKIGNAIAFDAVACVVPAGILLYNHFK